MDRRRLPSNLRSNRSDIQDLNDRANLIKIINNRENALKKRKELSDEYNEIMKRLHKAQMKKKKSLARSRGGVRNSRSWEIRRQEQFNRGERRKAGQEDSEVIGEVKTKDAEGNIQISYRDYNEEERLRLADIQRNQAEVLRLENRSDAQRQAEQIRIDERKIEADIQRGLDEARLDQIRAEDIQLRFEEKARDRQDAEIRHRENYALQKEFRDREDQFRAVTMQRDDDNSAMNRLIQGRQLDYAEARMRQGEDFMRSLLELDQRLNRRFDTAELQFKNLLQENRPVELQNLVDENRGRIQPGGVIELPNIPSEGRSDADDIFADLERALSEGDGEFVIPTDEQEEEGGTPPQRTPTLLPQPETPGFTPSRHYADDLPPNKEIRQPEGRKRSYQEDLDIISQYLVIPKEGTPARVEFDNSLGAGEFDGVFELINSAPGLPRAPSGGSTGSVTLGELTSRPELFDPAELQKEILDANDLRGDIDADKKRIEELKKQIEAEKKSKLDRSLEQLQGIPEEPSSEAGWARIGDEDPAESYLKLEKQKFFDSLTPGLNFTNPDGDIVGYNNPLNTPEEQAEIQQKAQQKGEFTIGTQAALQQGITQTPRDNPKEKNKNKFIPGKYQKEQKVMYYRKERGGGAWRPAKILDYRSDDAGEAQITIQRTTGGKSKQAPIETIYDRIVPVPDEGMRLKQKALREEIRSGIFRDEDTAQGRRGSGKSSFWKDKDKFIITNNTSYEFRGIKPGGKSVLNYHKENPRNYEENTYFHTPLDDDGTWLEGKTKRVIHPMYLDPALDRGLLSLEKLEKPQPYKKRKDSPKGLQSGPSGFKSPPAAPAAPAEDDLGSPLSPGTLKDLEKGAPPEDDDENIII